MSELRPDRLAAQLAAEPLRPAYLVAGPEALVVLEAADAIRAAAREQGIGDREVFDIEGRDPDWDSLSAAFNAPGLFATRRVVEVRMPTGKPGKEGAEVFTEFAANPPPDVVLLVTCADWSRQHGGKWSEALGRIGHQVIAWPIKPHELPDWIERRLRARGLRADRDAVQALAERVEGNLLAAAQEIDKLALLADGNTIDLARMQALVSDSARYDVFRLVDAAMNGEGAQVSRMLHGLRSEGEAVPALLGMVCMELQRAAALSRVQARGGNLNAEFKAQRIWDSKQAAYTRALQRHDAARWERFAAEAGRVDRIAKGRPRWGQDPMDAWIALERVLLAVANPKAMRLLG
ncbi:DNA polymerase III subunit delta [Lysobacter helvus]|uniref:DNA polymerase III subunit delta n=2 Tax=Lysobacteraceae TaxID=32033 RepID=A0ABM7Q6W0_9GAMM|nr:MULTISPECIES: DNA polymerase III subunit delta [Lysobacter]BCT93072.1 DNA polymerase III subunit delta [Lysobacter caseinilyticus]BCT96224.1 DNA polymerase III subunit delta [Lysobacter helvus]